MRIPRTVAIVAFVMLCAAAQPAGALAGGWSVTTLDRTPTNIEAGEAFTIGFVVRQHGDKPMAGLTPRITALNAATGERVTAIAVAEGAVGHYVATLTLPSAGTWTWEIAAFGEPARMSPLQVGAPGSARADAALVGRVGAWLWPALSVIALVGLFADALGLAWTRRDRRVARA